jgi:predicted RNase H-like HicB family nuclease
MQISIALNKEDSGAFQASAPDLPGCSLVDPDKDRAFARLRLVIEGALADALLAGKPLPAVHPPGHWRDDPRYAGALWYEAHMNVAHIEAVARHQRGRRPG